MGIVVDEEDTCGHGAGILNRSRFVTGNETVFIRPLPKHAGGPIGPGHLIIGIWGVESDAVVQSPHQQMCLFSVI